MQAFIETRLLPTFHPKQKATLGRVLFDKEVLGEISRQIRKTVSQSFSFNINTIPQ
jgi:hypothetical protein